MEKTQVGKGQKEVHKQKEVLEDLTVTQVSNYAKVLHPTLLFCLKELKEQCHPSLKQPNSKNTLNKA